MRLRNEINMMIQKSYFSENFYTTSVLPSGEARILKWGERSQNIFKKIVKN